MKNWKFLVRHNRGRRGALAVVRRFIESNSANVAIVAAIVLPALVGFAGMGSEVGYWYYRQRDLQGAADVAAYDGAIALRSGQDSNQVTALATSVAGENGWNAASGTIAVHTPPTSGENKNSNSVEVSLTEIEKRYFTALFKAEAVPIKARSVATFTASGKACMLGLNKAKSGTVQFWGNATAAFNDCNVVSNSAANDSFKLGGNAKVTAPCVSAVGGADVTGLLTLTSCMSVIEKAPAVDDPYSAVPAPPIPGACTNPPANGALSAGKYCGGLTLNDTRTLNPGVYVISGGPLKVNANANLTGSGVTFYLTNGATMQFNGNANMNLSAPTSGTYSGLLFFGDRTQPNADNTMNGTANSKLTGAIYFPSQTVNLLGSFSGNNGCLQVVSDTIYYTGDGAFSANCAGTGLADLTVPGSIALVE